jgi:uncharacterized membrane protein
LTWFWSFVFYSFLGFVLETIYAKITGGNLNRKCLWVLPLCPVYGFGACLIVGLAYKSDLPLPACFLLGSLLATIAEYFAALFYEKILHVSFWNYQGLPGNFQGRVCLLFSFAWGILSLFLVHWVHPQVSLWFSHIPLFLSQFALVTVVIDALFSAILLRRTGTITCLQWHSQPYTT